MTSKYQVLKRLNENKDQAMSGQKIGQSLGLSRNGVWKAIEGLRADGHSITGLANRGYVLEGLTKTLNPDSLRLGLSPDFDRAIIEIYPSSISTNSLCKEAMEKDGIRKALIVSREQVNGKGRQGKSFHSPRGGLYFSFGFKPQSPDFDPTLLTIGASLALVDSFKDLYGLDLGIKWVNDLFFNEKKVCGILTEGSINMETGLLDYVICGIGINLVQKEAYPDKLNLIMGPIFEKLPQDFDPNILVSRIIIKFFQCMGHEDLINKYKASCQTLGQDISFEKANKTLYGRAKDIDSQGRLLVDMEDGTVESLSFGQVSIKKVD